MRKTALITGVSGQDGAYLSRLLLNRGYRVLGTSRPRSAAPPARLVELKIDREVEIVPLDLVKFDDIVRGLERIRPDEVYHLAAQSSAGASFDRALDTVEIGAMGAARLIEAIRAVDPAIRFFQASTCDMFGEAREVPQNENTALRPGNPYAVAKSFAHWQTVCYREHRGLFGVCGILFNHESPLRGREFVTRKITLGLAEIKHGQRDVLRLGRLDTRRDWGFAGDYVEGMWRMLQQAEPDDYVLATGVSASVRDFADLAAKRLGFLLEWSGSGNSEIGIDRRTGRTVIQVTPELYRPAENANRIGDASKAKMKIGWKPTVTLADLVTMMAEADDRRVRDGLLSA
jgi:GDPmannose 4,6-dehydratase